MSLTVEESNFLRFYFLNLKITPKAVRVYFDSIYPPAGLARELKNNETNLKRLWFITSPQRKILDPGSVNIVKSEQFDTTLMICLLRNMNPCKVVPAPSKGWDNLPQAANTGYTDDLARAKWYRNFVSHHEKGELSGKDFSQYWGDLEQAIGRLGGPSMHKEAQSAQHVILDTSLTDMLLELKNCEKSQQEQTDKINKAIDRLNTNKEELKNKFHQLNVSNQQWEAETQKQTKKLSDYKDTVNACAKDIETCEKDIKNNKEMIKELQDQSITKQNEIDNLITKIDKLKIRCEHHDKILKEHEEHLTKQDGQIDTCVKSIDDIKQKLHDTDNTSGKINFLFD
ncbi:unnamed protein product [Mytilus coruscus]|uniref:DZIP3-like HEPN domain-containing protein n=1 Tax=Mytilus coruscus TaxID=42192 RepID=A0A6J8EXY4_MYTCO|nr:unnamed protein product [Mytilus coruscus]